MPLFRRLYNKLLGWSSHPHAPYYLTGVSFIESSVFPIPPDVMLIPMIFAKPYKAWEYAMLTTLGSVLGGILGYALGYYAFEMVGAWLIQAWGYQEAYMKAVQWFEEYGLLAMIVVGFIPIPYKLFTLAAGVSQMAMGPFLIGSLLGRGARFFFVAAIIRLFGRKIEPVISKYIDFFAWGTLALLGMIVIGYQFI